MRYKAL